jgi:hypothetical protein
VDVRRDEQAWRVGPVHELANDDVGPEQQPGHQEDEARLDVAADQRRHAAIIADGRMPPPSVRGPDGPDQRVVLVITLVSMESACRQEDPVHLLDGHQIVRQPLTSSSSIPGMRNPDPPCSSPKGT